MAAGALGFVHRAESKGREKGKNARKGRCYAQYVVEDCKKSGLSLAEVRSGSRRDRFTCGGTKIVRGTGFSMAHRWFLTSSWRSYSTSRISSRYRSSMILNTPMANSATKKNA